MLYIDDPKDDSDTDGDSTNGGDTPSADGDVPTDGTPAAA